MTETSQFQKLVGDALRFWFSDIKIEENYRPDWLFGMELDFYIPEYRVGIEVQGRQHYLWAPQMQATVDDYKAQRERDILKRRLARQRGVQIIVVRKFRGLYRKLRNVFLDRKFPVLPLELRQEMKAYRRQFHQLNQNKWVAIKVKPGGKLHGTNRVSNDYLKAIYQRRRHGKKNKRK